MAGQKTISGLNYINLGGLMVRIDGSESYCPGVRLMDANVLCEYWRVTGRVLL